MAAKRLFAIVLLTLLAAAAQATVFLIPTDRELVERSEGVVVGTVS